MFGIKKLQTEVCILNELIKKIQMDMQVSASQEKQFQKMVTSTFIDQKLELSGIKNRFHDLGDKFEKTQNAITKYSQFSEEASRIHDELLEKIVTDDAVLQHIKELNEKMSFLFGYMKQLEKLLGNVEIIVDQCLPELTIKLPKKKKATTAAS